MIFEHNFYHPNPLRDAMSKAYRADETTLINQLLKDATMDPTAKERIHATAQKLLLEMRHRRANESGLEAFLHQYDLSSEEGVALMCMAEALLRVPDNYTVDRLISDKLSTASWNEHLNKSSSLFVNAATWSLLLTGKIFAPTLDNQKSLFASLKRTFSRLGEAVIRPVILQGMKMIGNQFVMGTTINDALKRAKKLEKKGYRYSYDMLGEAARTKDDAEKYYKSYLEAIHAIGHSSVGLDPIHGPGISVKLSALHPRYELGKKELVFNELVARVLALAKAAKEHQIGMTIDAEEADRLDFSLDIIEAVFSSPTLNGWEGFGLAVQSYQKRAPFVIDWLADLSKKHQRRLMVRLIKGAYWDTEIKVSQLLGLEGYPVFTRKNGTDVSFIACAKKLLAHPDCFYPQFGTHNAHSVATIIELTKGRKDFEFQCLHGMGEILYDQLIGEYPCRIYAPVGTHKDLLGYLVRRLLENGANTSFINHISDKDIPIEKIIADPVDKMSYVTEKPHPKIPLPKNIFQNPSAPPNVARVNSKGLDLSNLLTLNNLQSDLEKADKNNFEAGPIIDGKMLKIGDKAWVQSPSDRTKTVGEVYSATPEDVEHAFDVAAKGFKEWADTPVEKRASILERAADLIEDNIPTLMLLLNREGGKHLVDCLSEIRETVDYCRYYAARARVDFIPHELDGPTGEKNIFSLHPRGTIVCISPWNFPLAIFAGQMLAAIVAGNMVLAKPAEQTPLIAAFAVKLFHEAGIPKNVLQLVTGRGSTIGAKLVADARVAGVMFTGSTDTAQIIQQSLAAKTGPLTPFIAETGGQNVMVVDSSALPEQVIFDIIQSSFNSAGQRCSASRVLCIQEDIADHVIHMLKGAMAELIVGDPSLLSTDVGPVIDKDALQMLLNHRDRMFTEGKLIFEVPMSHNLPGNFFAPIAFEIKSLNILKTEVFGPILHVIRYAAKDLNKILDDIINTGYGLTFGIHSRIDATQKYVLD
ncbi:MAG TPA: bifunctional proline dehydrogenase/L-glutamate gamma-semialdehyde dehydrogenase PutA, partial [Gammaproteobacteria bacterium]|nr:bifunctional proline dehydrogenase/L-glutamate gamma-semialdehyde dehydrogenase PutA [Gammaproteobacteria bacterium]